MSEKTYSKAEALQIAYDFHMKGGLDNLKDPKSGNTVGFGLSIRKTVMGMETGGYGGDRELIWKKEMLPNFEAELKDNQSYSATQLSEMLKPKGVSIAPDKISEVGEKLKLGTVSTIEKPKEATPSPNAKAEAEPKGATTPTKPAEDGSKPATMEAIKNFFGIDDYDKEIKRRKELPDYQGGILNGAQNLIILLITMFANVISGGKATIPDQKLTPDTQKPLKNEPTPAQQQGEQLTQQVQLAKSEEAQLEAQKPKKSPEPPRELVVEHFGEGGIRRNTEDMQKFQEALAQSHVPDGTNVSPSSSVGKSNHIQVGPDMSFGRSLG